MFSARAKPIAWPLFLFFFFFCTLIGTMMPYISVYYKSIGLTGSEIGRLMSLITLATIVVPHFWGWLTTRIGLPKLSLQLAVVGTFLAVLPFNLVSGFESYWLLTLIFSMFFAALMPLADSLAIRSIRNLGVPYTRIRAGGSIGYIVAVTICGFLIAEYGAWVVIPMMSVCMGIAMITTFFLKEQPLIRDSNKVVGSFFSLFREREVRFFLLLSFLSYMAHAPFNVFFAVHLNDAGYSGEEVGLLIAFGVVIEIVIFLFFGNSIRRFSVVNVVAFCFLCGVARWLLVGWYAEHLWIVLLTQLTHCVTFAVFHMVSIEQVHRLFPERYAAQGQAMYSAFAIGLGGGLGMVATGYVWQWFGGPWTFTFAAIVSLLALIILMLNQRR